MKKINKKFLALALTGLCFVGAGITASVLTQEEVATVSAEMIDTVVMDTYVKGETFTMPESVTVKDGETEYEATDGYVVLPDGKAYKKGAIELTDCGVYTLVYEKTVDGKRLVASKEFTVRDGVFTVETEKSTIAFGELNEQFAGAWDYTEGLLVDLAEGDTFRYNRPINVYEQDYSEILAFNCMTDDLSVGAVTIRLTDCYDSSNYMDIMYLRLYANELYVRVGISGQATCAVYNVGSPDAYVYIDDIQYRVFRNKAGAMLPCNRSEEVLQGKRDPYANNIKFALDAKDKDHLRVYGLTDTEPRTTLITELNNEVIYPYTWDGFTTGDVFLSLSASGFVSRELAPLQVAAIMGVSGEQLRPDQYADTTAPTVTLDGNATTAKIVQGVPVKVPGASAQDISGIVGEVDYTVYYGYGTSAQRMVSVEKGYFTPNAFGTYTVVYRATDRYGNVGEATFVMYAEKSGERGIDFTYDKVTDVIAGDIVSFASYTANGLNGDVSVAVSVTDVDGKKTAYKPTDLVQLARAGVYTIEYTYGDGVYSYVDSYQLTVVNGNEIRFESLIATPKYFIKNATYTIDPVNAYKYTDQAPMVASTQAYVSFDNGEYKACDIAELKIDGASSVKIKIVSTENADVFIESETIPVVDVGFGGRLTYANYFAGDFENAPSNASIVYTTKNAGSSTLDLVTPISLNNFYFAFGALSDAPFKALTVTLTDYYDHAKKVDIVLSQQGDNYYFSVNEKSIRLSKAYNLGERQFVNYDGTQFSFNTDNVIPYDAGFTTGKCLMSITLPDASADTPIEIYQVCNQVIRGLLSDTVDPQISVVAPERIAYIGDKFSVYVPVVTDVLSPIVGKNVTVSVYYDGKPIESTDGVLMNRIADFTRTYEIEITSYGDYLVIYNYTDGRNAMSHTEIVKVIDREAPTMTLEVTEVTVAVEENVAPVEVTASDNITASEDLTFWYIIVNERGQVEKSAKGTFYLTKKGDYTVYVYCSDETGNYVRSSYTLHVV